MKDWKLISLIALIALIGVGFFISNNRASFVDDNIANVTPTTPPTDDTSEGEPVTMEGTIICLPHKDTSGPVTLECAFGLRSEDANYGLIEQDGVLIYDVGDRVEVIGTLIPVDELADDDRLRIYDIEGVIDASFVELLE